MAVDIGPKIGIDGEAEFRKQLKDISETVKTYGAEIKAVSTQMDDFTSAEDRNKAKAATLNQAIEGQKEKVALLTKAVQESSDKYGEHDQKTEKWKQALANAQTQLNGMESELKSCTEETKKSADAAENGSSKWEGFGNVVKASAVAIGAAATAAAAASVELGKAVVESFANYEQLVGGVETLFKESSDTVQKYAEDAYKTSGMSANEYMETVTSFSAALIQSTGRGEQQNIEQLKEQFKQEEKLKKQSLQDQYDARKKELEAEIKALSSSYSSSNSATKASLSEQTTAIKNATTEQVNALKAGWTDNTKAGKAALKEQIAQIKAASKEQIAEAKSAASQVTSANSAASSSQVAKLKEAKEQELKELKRANETALEEFKKANKEKLAAAEEANMTSVTTEESLAKAAELADLAITDMSDNANKMGSSMESIKTAYQGFAKSNYTMLDNLNTMGSLVA